MKEIAVPLSEAETHLLCGLLGSERIPARVRVNPWFMPGSSAKSFSGTRIIVEEHDFERAEKFVSEYLAARAKRIVAHDDLRDAKPTWTCWRCGEDVETQFAVCWKCGEERVNDWV